VFTAPDWVWGPPLDDADDHRFQAAYLDFLDQMLRTTPTNVTTILLTHDRACALAYEWANERRKTALQVLPIIDKCRFTVWARDPFLIMQGPDGPSALAPCAFPRAHDQDFAPQAAAALELPFERSDVFFQGGNVIADDRAILIGADDHAMTLRGRPEGKRSLSAASFARRIASPHRALVLAARGYSCAQSYVSFKGREGWLERLHAGSPPNSQQPVYHLDMFLAPLGAGRIAVGDTRLARNFLASTHIDNSLDGALDDIARRLARAGYTITRAPLPLLFRDNMAAKVRNWYFASPLNVISDPVARRVWVPTLSEGAESGGLASINAFHAAMWRAAEFEVIPLNNLDPILRRLGGPRCLAQALPRRSCYIPPACDTDESRA